jgi:hypothetical protein
MTEWVLGEGIIHNPAVSGNFILGEGVRPMLGRQHQVEEYGPSEDEPENKDFVEENAQGSLLLPYTWWVFDDDSYGVPIIKGDILQTENSQLPAMFKRLGVYPFKNMDGNQLIFPARFEFITYNKDFQFGAAVFIQNALGWIDFLCGIPFESPELLTIIDEYDDPAKVASIQASGNDATPPFPKSLFAGYDGDKLLLNLLFIWGDNSDPMAKSITDPDAKSHWWFRCNLPNKLVTPPQFISLVGQSPNEGKPPKYPTPGGFLGMGIRLMPDQPWGTQDSSPFIYTGNFCDTVYYSRGTVTGSRVDENSGLTIYQVLWHDGNTYDVLASDFNEYNEGDEVAIVKDVSTEKQSQLWKDDDFTTFGDNWQIAPVTFYQAAEEES